MKFLLSINNGLAQVKKFSSILRIVNVVVKTIEFAQSEFEKEFAVELKEFKEDDRGTNTGNSENPTA